MNTSCHMSSPAKADKVGLVFKCNVLYIETYSIGLMQISYRKNNHLLHYRRHLDLHLLKSSRCISIAIILLTCKPFTPSIF